MIHFIKQLLQFSSDFQNFKFLMYKNLFVGRCWCKLKQIRSHFFVKWLWRRESATLPLQFCPQMITWLCFTDVYALFSSWTFALHENLRLFCNLQSNTLCALRNVSAPQKCPVEYYHWYKTWSALFQICLFTHFGLYFLRLGLLFIRSGLHFL